MELLYYNELDFSKVRNQFEKTIKYLRDGNFIAADIRKMPETGYYRAKLDDKNHLLFKFAKYNNQTYILLLEVILHHDYASSKFLRGVPVDENKLHLLPDMQQVPPDDVAVLSYINSGRKHFHLLDKIISFDNEQHDIFHLPTPLIIIGSAGSGKTALTLEKMKTLKGNILYITLSPFLVEHSANIYYSFNYRNEEQEVDFLSFKEFIETLQIPEGKEIIFRTFEQWFSPYRPYVKIKDAHKLFEEFKGVITGAGIEKEYLTKEEYLHLGIKQSVFSAEEREHAYTLFEKYLQFLKENKQYDLNIISHKWLPLCKPKYDFIIIDEVQDITNIQLYLIIKSLKKSADFILCGDSNQVVHPNFFSWGNIKTMFYKNEVHGNVTRILTTNYRNSPQVTALANTLLKIKNSRFGSIDKESTYLINSISTKDGEVEFLEDNIKLKQELNQKTKQSAKYAVIVMRDEDKAEARKSFTTPLLFSIHEAKGLEYENIILLNFISGNDKEFREITNGVTVADITADEINYSRAKDKSDKSLEVYKFYVNSLYVAITRAVRNLYIIEQHQKHEILNLLGLINAKQQVTLQQQSSTLDDWKKEAHKLEQQGKAEQAELIRKTILGTQATPWKPITLQELEVLKKEAFNPEAFNKKAKDKIFDYALIYNDAPIMKKLAELNYRRAERYETERGSIFRRYYQDYKNDDVKRIMNNVNKYGVDYRDEYNMTPLLAAVQAGAINTSRYLLEIGTMASLVDNLGKNALQTVLFQSYLSPDYQKNKSDKIYPLVLTESIKVKVDNHLVKIDNHKVEYFILNFLIAIQTSIIKRKKITEPLGLTMDDFVNNVSAYSSAVLPEFRKQRPYLNSILAKNEINRIDIYNKKLFLRLEKGTYVLNPELEIQTGEDWINVYELMQTEKITKEKCLELANNVYNELIEKIKIKKEAIIEARQDQWDETRHSQKLQMLVNEQAQLIEARKIIETRRLKYLEEQFKKTATYIE